MCYLDHFLYLLLQQKLKNPNKEWFAIGVCDKKKFEREFRAHLQPTFYGIARTCQWYLAGKFMGHNKSNLTGTNGEILRENIRTEHFNGTEVELDVCLDLDNNGLLKIKNIANKEEDQYEAQVSGINKCPQLSNGWIPQFDFYGGNDNAQEVQMAKINPRFYGKPLDINW